MAYGGTRKNGTSYCKLRMCKGIMLRRHSLLNFLFYFQYQMNVNSRQDPDMRELHPWYSGSGRTRT